MGNRQTEIFGLDPNGFNELRSCRSGPLLYNKYDIYVGGSLKKYGEFSYGEQQLFDQIVGRGDNVLEIGANIGAHTVSLSKSAGPEGTVYAFEPQRLVFQTLCANLALNQCQNVYAYQMAVGAEKGVLSVPELDPANPDNFGGVSLIADQLIPTPKHHEVPQVTLDSLDLPGCSFLKVDVEGMEIEVLKGAEHLISAHRPIMYLENDRLERSKELIELVMQSKYDIYWHLPALYNPNNFAGDVENIFPGLASMNILCLPSEDGISVADLPRVDSSDQTWEDVLGLRRK